MAKIFRSILDREQGKLAAAQRRVFTKYADSAPPPVDYAAQSRALDDYLGETPAQPPVTPPTPEALAARQRQSQAGILQRDQLARQEFEDAARRSAPATRPFTFAEDVAKPIGEAFGELSEPPEVLGKVAGVPITDPYATEKRILGIGQEVFRPVGEIGGGLISAGGGRAEFGGRNFADQLGIQQSDDVGTILGKVRDYQRTRPEAERFITENLALLALDPAFKGAAEAARLISRGAGPAAKVVGQAVREVAASEEGRLGDYAIRAAKAKAAEAAPLKSEWWNVEGKSTNKGAIWRAEKNSHWADFDKNGNIVGQGNGWQNAPTPQEITQFSDEARVVAARASKVSLPKEIYIRFGDIPKSGRSANAITRHTEEGVSVYSAEYSPFTDTILYKEEGTVPNLGGFIVEGRPAYLVQGNYAGRGGDGEPLLKNVRVVARLSPKKQGFEVPATFRSVTPEVTPKAGAPEAAAPTQPTTPVSPTPPAAAAERVTPPTAPAATPPTTPAAAPVRAPAAAQGVTPTMTAEERVALQRAEAQRVREPETTAQDIVAALRRARAEIRAEDAQRLSEIAAGARTGLREAIPSIEAERAATLDALTAQRRGIYQGIKQANIDLRLSPEGYANPPYGGGRVPPTTGGRGQGGAPLPDRFPEPIEKLIASAKDVTKDDAMLRYALQDLAERAQPLVGVKKAFSIARGALLGEGARFRNPDLQISWMGASRYASAQAERANEVIHGMAGMLKSAFGKDAVIKEEPILRDKFTGTITRANEKYVGTLWHVLDNPDLYRGLTPLQKRAAQEWGDILNAERTFTARMGVNIGEVEGNWIAHTFKDYQKALDAISASPAFRGKPGLAKTRRLTTEQFLDVALDKGLDVQNDVLQILVRRLSSTARMRTGEAFVSEVAKKFGGRATTGQRIPVGMDSIQVNGKVWAFPKEVAEQVKALLQPMTATVDEAMAAKVVDTLRGTLLNLDASVGFGRQGLLGMMADPVRGAKAYGQAWTQLHDPLGMQIHLAQNADAYVYAAQRGLILNMTPLDMTIGIAGKPSHYLDRVPLVGKFNEVQFSTIMRPLKLAVFERNLANLRAIRDGTGLEGFIQKMPLYRQAVGKMGGRILKMTDDELADAAADMANNWVGGIDWNKIGVSPGVMRKLLVLTEGWTRANVGVFTSAAQATPKGILARQLLAQELAVATGFSVALNQVISNSMPELDIRSTKFLDVKTPWGYFSILPHKSYMRAIAGAVGGKKPGEYGPDDAIEERIGALAGFATGRVGQIPRIVTDLSRNEEFGGKRIYEPKAPLGTQLGQVGGYLGRSMAPIIVGSTIDQLEEQETPETMAAQGAIGFSGLSTRTFSMTDRLSEISKQVHGRPWQDLTTSEQRQMEQRPDVRDIQAKQGVRTEGQAKRTMRQASYDAQVLRDTGVEKGRLNNRAYGWEDWEKDIRDAAVKSSGASETWEALRPFVERPPKNENEAALQGLYKLQESFRLPGDQFDFHGFAPAEDDYMENLTSEQRRYIQQEVHPNATPRVKALYALKEQARPYTQAARTLIGRDQELARLYDEHQSLGASQQSALRKEHPNLAKLVKDIDAAKEKARKDSPSADLYAHLFNGANLKNKSNLDAAKAGKLTFAGVKVEAYTPSAGTSGVLRPLGTGAPSTGAKQTPRLFMTPTPPAFSPSAPVGTQRIFTRP